jgi:hypothetical protein
MIDKQTIFEEFKIAKQKDLQQSTTNEPYEDCFTNRLQLLNSHKVAKKSNPKMYRNLDINFDNLILAYSSPVPVDHFYKKVFGLSLQEYKYKKYVEEMTEKQKEKEEKLKKEQKEKLKIEDVEEITFN